MAIYQFLCKIHISGIFQLYIPLWLYINGWSALIICKYYSFTFHFGYISMTIENVTGAVVITLHSTLAIYQYEEGIYYRTITHFTFHFGYISILLRRHSLVFQIALHSTLAIYQYENLELLQPGNIVFTFHFGYISIYSHIRFVPYKLLYIPLWLYINRRRSFRCFHGLQLYIPLWLYINPLRRYMPRCQVNFTFHFGYISIIYCRPQARHCCSLHSTLAIYQFLRSRFSAYSSRLYIPLWLYINSLLLHTVTICSQLYIPLWLYINLSSPIFLM